MKIRLLNGYFSCAMTIATNHGRFEIVPVNERSLRPLCDLMKETDSNEHVIVIQIWSFRNKILLITCQSRRIR